MRKETGDRRQEIGDRRHVTGDMRSPVTDSRASSKILSLVTILVAFVFSMPIGLTEDFI